MKYTGIVSLHPPIYAHFLAETFLIPKIAFKLQASHLLCVWPKQLWKSKELGNWKVISTHQITFFGGGELFHSLCRSLRPRRFSAGIATHQGWHLNGLVFNTNIMTGLHPMEIPAGMITAEHRPLLSLHQTQRGGATQRERCFPSIRHGTHTHTRRDLPFTFPAPWLTFMQRRVLISAPISPASSNANWKYTIKNLPPYMQTHKHSITERDGNPHEGLPANFSPRAYQKYKIIYNII